MQLSFDCLSWYIFKAMNIIFLHVITNMPTCCMTILPSPLLYNIIRWLFAYMMKLLESGRIVQQHARLFYLYLVFHFHHKHSYLSPPLSQDCFPLQKICSCGLHALHMHQDPLTITYQTTNSPWPWQKIVGAKCHILACPIFSSLLYY